MPRLVPNMYSNYELTEAEHESGMQLTDLNRCVIQNLISGMAAEKVVAEIEENWNYRLRQAHLQGGIETLKYLLSLDELQKERILEEAKQAPQ